MDRDCFNPGCRAHNADLISLDYRDRHYDDDDDYDDNEITNNNVTESNCSELSLHVVESTSKLSRQLSEVLFFAVTSSAVASSLVLFPA